MWPAAAWGCCARVEGRGGSHGGVVGDQVLRRRPFESAAASGLISVIIASSWNTFLAQLHHCFPAIGLPAHVRHIILPPYPAPCRLSALD